MSQKQSFIERYASAFGRNQGTLLKLSGMLGAEVEASGAVVRDDQGKDYLDFGSFGLHLLGHRHPEVVKAAIDQLGLMGLPTKILGGEAATRLAELLLSVTPDSLNRVVFANSGAEAVDMAIKLAIQGTGRKEFISFRHSYHGKTLGALSLSDTMKGHRDLAAGHPVHFIDVDDIEGLSSLLESRQIAAVFVEPIQGEGGINPISEAFLTQLRKLCSESETLLVFDEIQTGLGRCGKVWRSANEVVPDLLLSGKTLGGGFVPIAAVIFSSMVIRDQMSDPILLASSFAGGALASRIGASVVEIISSDSFLDRVQTMGAKTMASLKTELDQNPGVVDIRGEGLMIGVEVSDPAIAGHALINAAELGVLLTFCLHEPRVLRVYPPAVCTPQQLDSGLQRIIESISSAAKKVLK